MQAMAMAMRLSKFIKLLTEHKNGIECCIIISITHIDWFLAYGFWLL